jgi:transposase
LRQIKNCVKFDFIYEKAAPYDSHMGRKSIVPVILIKMLLIGYLYGIKSERRLEEEASLNLVYRWFCGIDLTERAVMRRSRP